MLFAEGNVVSVRESCRNRCVQHLFNNSQNICCQPRSDGYSHSSRPFAPARTRNPRPLQNQRRARTPEWVATRNPRCLAPGSDLLKILRPDRVTGRLLRTQIHHRSPPAATAEVSLPLPHPTPLPPPACFPLPDPLTRAINPS
jgi:hypothetical protein